MWKKNRFFSTLLITVSAILLLYGCKKDYPGEKYFTAKWRILKVVVSGETEPVIESPGYIDFRKDGTGHFHFEFVDDTLDSDFAYVIEYFARPWPQDKHPEETGEDNGPNRITLYNLIYNNRLMWEYGSINFSVEYVKKRKKMTMLYDELYNCNTPFDNFEGTKLYFICESE